jgi:hypothetical protein
MRRRLPPANSIFPPAALIEPLCPEASVKLAPLRLKFCNATEKYQHS